MIQPATLRGVLQRCSAPSFEQLLNLWSIEEDAILIGLDLQYTKLYRLKCPDLLFSPPSALEQHSRVLARLLDLLPENCTVQHLARVRWNSSKHATHGEITARSGDAMLRVISRARGELLSSLPFKSVDHFLSFTTYPPLAKRLTPAIRSVWLKPDPRPRLAADHIARVDALKSLCANALSCLRDARISAEALEESAVRELLFERLNPAASRTMPPPRRHPSNTLRSELALNACDASFDTLTLDGHHHRALNLHLQPTEISATDIPLLLEQIPGDFDLAIAVHTTNQEAAQKQVQLRSTGAAILGSLSPFSRYHEADLAAAEAEALLAHVKADSQKLYLMTCHAVLRDVDLKRLTAASDQTLAAFRKMDDAVAIVDDMNHLHLFLASLPGHSHLNPRAQAVPTDAAARYLAQSASYEGCPNPHFLTPADDGKLLGVDLFSPELTTKHGLILGVSGEGKSVLTNALMTSFYGAREDNHVVVIDDGGSYRRLCGLLGGQYLEPTLDGSYSFNPFLAREHAFLGPKELDADFLSFITLLVQLMVRRPDLTNNEKSIIQKAVLAAYVLAAGRTPLLEDLREAFRTFQGDEDDTRRAQDFFKNLELWTHGTYGRLLNRPSSFDVKARFLVFDLNKLTQEDLKPVLLLIIKSTIHPKMADKRLRKLIVLDEVWKFLRDKAGADLATEWYKTGRRFNGGVLVVTQSAEDLLSSAAAEAIAHNSSVQWILNIGGGYEKLAALKLSEEEIQAVRELGKNAERSKYRKVFLKFGQNRAIIRNQLSPLEYWLYTTDPNDVNREAALRQAHPDWTPLRVLETLAKANR